MRTRLLSQAKAIEQGLTAIAEGQLGVSNTRDIL